MLRRMWDRWKFYGRFIGNLLARVVLTIFYITVFVPFGIGSRLFSDHLGIQTMPDQLWQIRDTPDQTIESSRRQA